VFIVADELNVCEDVFSLVRSVALQTWISWMCWRKAWSESCWWLEVAARSSLSTRRQSCQYLPGMGWSASVGGRYA